MAVEAKVKLRKNDVVKVISGREKDEKGGITSIEAPLSVSKLMIVCKKCGPTRIGYKIDGEAKKRVCRTCGGEL
jgi:large subunit ribosomal protein L24